MAFYQIMLNRNIIEKKIFYFGYVEVKSKQECAKSFFKRQYTYWHFPNLCETGTQLRKELWKEKLLVKSKRECCVFFPNNTLSGGISAHLHLTVGAF
jgi:hypothetical protein